MSDWNMLAALVRDGERVVDHRFFLLHKSQYEIVDDWQVLGMRATRSMTVTAKDQFVPDYKTLCAYDIRGGDGFPGARVNTHPVFRVPVLTLGGHGVVACAIGNAQAALEHMIASVKERSTNYTGAKMRDFQTVQLRIGSAGALIDTACVMMRADCIEGQETANRGLVPDIETKLRYKRNAAFATAPLQRGRGHAARHGGRERHLPVLPAGAHLPRGARAVGARHLPLRYAGLGVGVRRAGRRSEQSHAVDKASQIRDIFLSPHASVRPNALAVFRITGFRPLRAIASNSAVAIWR